MGKSGNRKTTTPPLKCFHTQLIPVGKEKKNVTRKIGLCEQFNRLRCCDKSQQEKHLNTYTEKKSQRAADKEVVFSVSDVHLRSCDLCLRMASRSH